MKMNSLEHSNWKSLKRILKIYSKAVLKKIS